MFCTWHFYMKLVWYVPRLISIPHQGWHQSIKIRTVVAFIDSYWGPLHENVGDEHIRTGFGKVWSQNFALKTLHIKSFRIWLIINCICMFTSISILIMTELACVKWSNWCKVVLRTGSPEMDWFKPLVMLVAGTSLVPPSLFLCFVTGNSNSTMSLKHEDCSS